MSEDAVALWIRRADRDLKIGENELAGQNPATKRACVVKARDPKPLPDPNLRK